MRPGLSFKVALRVGSLLSLVYGRQLRGYYSFRTSLLVIHLLAFLPPDSCLFICSWDARLIFMHSLRTKFDKEKSGSTHNKSVQFRI